MENKYSKIYRTRTSLFRYNYQTQKVEQIKKAIRKVNQGGIMSALVVLDVIGEYEVDKAKFEENPEYWVELCDSSCN